MWYVSSVVVVLPLLPVMAIIFPGQNQLAYSISETRGIPFSLIFLIKGAFSGMPGLLMMRSEARIFSSLWPPSSKRIYMAVSCALYFSLSGFMSLRKGFLPCFCASSAAPMPLSPPPRIDMFIASLYINEVWGLQRLLPPERCPRSRSGSQSYFRYNPIFDSDDVKATSGKFCALRQISFWCI